MTIINLDPHAPDDTAHTRPDPATFPSCSCSFKKCTKTPIAVKLLPKPPAAVKQHVPKPPTAVKQHVPKPPVAVNSGNRKLAKRVNVCWVKDGSE